MVVVFVVGWYFVFGIVWCVVELFFVEVDDVVVFGGVVFKYVLW